MSDEEDVLQVDDIIRKKLLYAKQFYVHGEKHARHQNPVDRMIAIHHFHAAIEIAIKAVFSQLFPEDKIGFTRFNTIVKRIRPQCPWITDSRVEFLKRLNERRNDVQHAAEVLATEHMPEYQVKSKDFLIVCFQDKFGLSFDDLDLTEAISDQKFKQLLVWSKELIDMNEYELSMMFCKIIYELTLSAIEPDIFELKRMQTYIDSDLRPNGNYGSLGTKENRFGFQRFLSDFYKFNDESAKAFKKLASYVERLFTLALIGDKIGSHEDFEQLKDVLSNYYLALSKEVKRAKPVTNKPNKDDAMWIRNYLVECLLHLQEKYPGLRFGERVVDFYTWAKSQIEAKREEATS